jgi:RimK family alpha-L-glutamate ligase
VVVVAKTNLIIAGLKPELFTIKRLVDEGLKLKHSVLYLNPYEFIVPLKSYKTQGLYFHRTTGTNYDDFDLTVTKHHEDLGLKITNPLNQLKLFRSKDLQSLFLKEQNLPTIPTLMYRGSMTEELSTEIKKLTPAKSEKYILKMTRGNQGIGVNFLESHKSLLSVLETFHAMKDQRFIIQPFIPHTREWRIFILKGVILAAIEKTLKKEDFRGNAKRSQGKLLKKIPRELEAISIKAFAASKLDYAGIDLLCTDNGEIKILEINAIPGFEQAEELSGKNIARELLIQLLL